jgi:HEAT repeat protein
MLTLLSKPLSGQVKQRLCAAIADAGDSESRHALRDLVLKPGPDRSLEDSAAMALIRVGDEDFLPRLLEMSKDPRLPEWILLAAVEACQVSPSRLATGFLLDRALSDRSIEVRLAAARALLGRELETVPELLARAQRGDLPEDVHFLCAFTLAKSGSAEADKWLVQELKKPDGKPTRRQSATRALALQDVAWSQSEEVRESLRRMATDPGEQQQIRVHCLRALRRIQKQQGWRLLRSGCWDAP